MIQEYLRLAFQSMWHRPLRSGLTILGIVIGIAAIVSLISVSQGLENAITAQFQQLGSNRMFVVPKGLAFTAGSVRTVLTTADAELLERMSDFKWVNQYLLDTLIVEFHKEKKSFSVTGLDTKDFGERAADLNLRLAQGRFFSDHETLAVLLGGRVPTEAFDKDVRLNTNLEIGGKKFKVVGILELVGNPDDDNAILMPLSTLRDLTGKKEDVSVMELVTKPGIDLQASAQEAQRRLERQRDDEDFDILTPEQILIQFGDILLIVQVVLVGIAGISLLVGGIGITNAMYTSVLQRREEIVILKSVGAQNRDILSLFLVEAGLLGLTGGILGVLLGLAFAKGTGVIAQQAGFPLLLIQVNVPLVLFGLAFACTIGSLAGLLPAYQAAKLKPAEALRGL